MTRVVLDTNIWVSLLVTPRSQCQQMVDGLIRTRVELATSRALLAELARVLKDKFAYRDAELQRALAFVQALCVVVDPPHHVEVIRTHEPDNRVLECALEANADMIVTGDAKHLLPLRTFRGIPIQSPRTVLERLG